MLHAGPSLRLCSCRPRVAIFANRVMLLRTNEEVVTVYVLNYALLLVWGVSSVMIEATIGAEKTITSNFSAYFALAIGVFCSLVHLLCPLLRCRRSRHPDEQLVRPCTSLLRPQARPRPIRAHAV